MGELLSLLGILYLERVQIAAASDLELGLLLALVDLDHLRIPAAGLLEEVADVGNFLWHGFKKESFNYKSDPGSDRWVRVKAWGGIK